MSMTKTICLVLLYMACGATGDLMLGYGRNPNLHAVHPLMWVVLGTTSLGIGYGIFLGLLKDVPLSVVVPAGAGSYIVIAALSKVVLHEPVPLQRWLGTLLVSVGVSMVMISDWQTRGAEMARAGAALPDEEQEIELPVPPLGVEVPVREPVGGSKR
jgi:drug/metabolite transporter (DMT)-like permease